MIRPPLAELERRLGIAVEDAQLLVTALTHRSAGSDNYERLEFLGDGILNAVIGAELFRLRPKASEGDLSRLRASLVCEPTLANIARELDLTDFVQVGAGETGSHRRASVLADVLEAIIGATYLDSGFVSAQELVLGWFARRLQSLPDPESLKDPKTRLQEYLQAREQPVPIYEVLSTTGPAHRRTFEVRCSIDGSVEALQSKAQGSSRRRAEQAAAESMLEMLANA